jgi:predicted Zn-dependent peptidase
MARILMRSKELEQSHLCLGAEGLPQNHADRYVGYVLNTMLGGSMSSRLFQNVREKRGLAYAIFSGLSAYKDAGMLTIYAGCAAESLREVVDVVVEEMRTMASVAPPEAELRRAKDHLKGSMTLSLENTSSRMSNLARHEMYFGRRSGRVAGRDRARRRAGRAAGRAGPLHSRYAVGHGAGPDERAAAVARAPGPAVTVARPR